MRIFKKILFFLGLFALLSFIANRIFFFNQGFLEKASAKITYPFLYLAHKVSTNIHGKIERKQRYDQLLQRYQTLTESYENLMQEHITFKATHHFNDLSKDLIDFQQRYHLEDKIVAKILLKNIDESEHFFLINRGAHHGIKKDMVALYKFQIVGRICDVFDNYSKLILITDQNCKVGAYTSKTNAYGIVHGMNNIGQCKLNYVSHLQDVDHDDLVLSSGQGLVFPEGFCLGKIVAYTLKDRALYHDIVIEPLIDLKKINFCMIVDQTKIKLF